MAQHRWGSNTKERDVRGARFAKSPACDACGRPIGRDHYTDDEVCQGGDGPGFYLCGRTSCLKRRMGMTADERRAYYQRQTTS